MKILVAIALVAATSLSHAAGNVESFLLAQAQTQTQKAVPKQAPKRVAKAAVPAPPPPGPSCNMDGRNVEDKATWCVKKNLQQCNASSGQWVNTGKRC